MDPSYASDRTTLAWRRTSLAVVTGVAVVGRLQFPGLDPVVLLAGVALILVVLAVALRWASQGPRDGRIAALVILATAALAGLELFRLCGFQWPK